MTNYQRGGNLVATNGLSLAGKSTIVGMTALRTKPESFEIIQENAIDPLRKTTSELNKRLKTKFYEAVLYELIKENQGNQLICETAQEAIKYVGAQDFDVGGGINSGGYIDAKQATLAYFFTKGRSIVNGEIISKLDAGKDIILDRSAVTGFAYQVGEWDYPWTDIMQLSESFGIRLPDLEIILTCPIDQIPLRRQFRTKIGQGTAGQMSGGREEEIYKALIQIKRYLTAEGVYDNTIMIENPGTPVRDLEEQITQILPTYLKVEDHIRKIIPGWQFEERMNEKQLLEFFLANKQFIYDRQCTGRVKLEDRKDLN